ncbi:MAG: tRNA 2-thiouridine(34) synthase MnmA [Candidatus Marinimicrobia bacterium]|nr:tRNA 2-thiouridine(34) synthase MnmA [Candidatus Neomarinimicrobiota bacterium]
MPEKVVLAMSGGVDSCVSAYLLKQHGYLPIGVSFLLYDGQSFENAKLVSEKIGIEHHLVDLQDMFRKSIIEPFIKEYLSGTTPNPCVVCNPNIKWDTLIKLAQDLKADYIATGHYARVMRDEKSKRVKLLKGIDRFKDQSYALWGLKQYQLVKTLFPLGEITKEKVKKLATKLGLADQEVRESQELCFIPEGDYRKFLLKYASEITSRFGYGKIVTESGEVVGYHRGFYNFTIGQRKGLKIAFGKRMYVKRIDPERNLVVVAEDSALFSKGMILKNVNWVSIEETENIAGICKIRYSHSGVWATAKRLENGKMEVIFREPQRAVTPGQSGVMYDGETLLLGGIIEKVLN